MPVPSQAFAPTQEFTVDGHKGAIHVRSWHAESPRAVVMIVHGYAEYGGRYTHVAEHLVAQGYSVVASDHVGHGLSEGERALIDDFAKVVDDLALALDAAFENGIAPAGTPTIMIGHSMGGLLTARFVQRWPDRLAGAGFLGAVLGDWKWARAVIAQPDMPEEDSDPMGMSRDVDVCRAYDEDPLVYRGLYKRPLLVAEVAALDELVTEFDRITIPVGFFHGAADPFVPYPDSLAAVEAMASVERTIHLYDEAKHELVNETNRDEVLADIDAWIASVLERS